MSHDRYLRGVLTVIACALVYLCVVMTPLPSAFAQGARTPGEPTGPAEVVVVGWKLAPGVGLPVQVMDPVTIAGEVRVGGRVQTEQAPNTASRIVLIGWEQNAAATGGGLFTSWQVNRGQALPVTTVPVK